MPLLSVILPTRNRARRLVGAIRSVLTQSETDLELIVVDDSSSDDTPDVVERAAEDDRRVRFERLSTSAAGPSAVRNFALRMAGGEYISFIDDDDRWEAAKARTQIEFLKNRAELGGASCYYTERRERPYRSAAFRGPTSYSAAALLWAHFSLGIFVMARRSAYADELIFDESLVTCEDWDLWLRCARIRPIATVPLVLCEVRFHREQATASTERRRVGREAFTRKHWKEMSERCRAYQRAKLEIMTMTGLRPRVELMRRLLRSATPDVAVLLARESMNGRLGRLVGDPGRGLRTLLRTAEREKGETGE